MNGSGEATPNYRRHFKDVKTTPVQYCKLLTCACGSLRIGILYCVGNYAFLFPYWEKKHMMGHI